MEKANAARIMRSALSLGEQINKLDAEVSDLSSPSEKEELVQALGSLMGILTRDFVLRIVREHPDLDPDR